MTLTVYQKLWCTPKNDVETKGLEGESGIDNKLCKWPHDKMTFDSTIKMKKNTSKGDLLKN